MPEDPKLSDEIRRMQQEPLLPVEKRLILWSLGLGVGLLGLLLWIVYKFVKNSGWRLTRVQASPAPTPSAAETPNVEVVEKKETE